MPPADRLGPYRLLRRLGVGGQGVVWEAELVGPASYRKRVALKVLEGKTDLAHEHRLGGLLGHPNLVEVYEVGLLDDTAWLAMELVDGRRLEDLVTREALPPRAVVDLGLGLAQALVHAHGRGVVHRDVTPGNVLVTDEGVVKLADLDLAVWIDEPGAQSAGTPGYCSPEQSRGEPPAPSSDLWSLGATLHRAATGRHLVGRSVPVDLRELEQSRAEVANALATCPALAELIEALTDPVAIRRPTSGEVVETLRALEAPGRSLGELLRADPGEPAEVGLGNLPAAAPRLFGRRDELDRVVVALRTARVVTLHGPGGIGKTHLAQHAAHHVAPPGGAWWVDLAAANSRDQVLQAVATSLGVKVDRTHPVRRLGAVLAGRPPLLLLLDGAEEILDEVAAVAEPWAAQAPGVMFLTTSRRALDLAAEVVVELGPLDPEAQRELFRHRAGEAGWDGSDRHRVDEVLAQVDGLPLAVELVAAQVAEAGVGEVLQRLANTTPSSPRGVPPALAAVLETSWARLSPTERSALGQLSVFEGTFTAEAVDEVLELDDEWALDALDALHRSALVVCRQQDEPRFHLYRSVQAFASARLAPAARRCAQVRHGRFYAVLGTEPALQATKTFGGERLLGRLQQARPNLAVACRRALARADPEVACAAALALWTVLDLTGPYAEGHALLVQVLEVPGLAPADQARTHTALSHVLQQLRQGEAALEHNTAALALYRELGDRAAEGSALYNLGTIFHKRGQFERARELYLEAIARCVSTGNRRGRALALGALGILDRTQGRSEEAVAHYRAALAEHEALGSRRSAAIVLGNLGNLHRERLHLDEAQRCYEAALRIHRELGDRATEGVLLPNLGVLHQHAGRTPDAQRCYEEGLRLSREVGDLGSVGGALTNLATLHERVGRLDEALAHNLAALEVYEELGNPFGVGAVRHNIALQLLGHPGRLDEARVHLEEVLQLGITHDIVLLRGIARGGLARWRRLMGALSEAARLVDQAVDDMRAAGHPVELGKLLCVRAEIALDQQRLDPAREDLDEARDLLDSGSEGDHRALVERLERSA